ncbi:uroporphyrinogen-III synthase [Phaeobacter sp. JH20_34]|uniref:uroporphyrinogen-III synthase n=2 Tax=Phaeobacter TaxID=302485 RepID=UPI003A883BC9
MVGLLMTRPRAAAERFVADLPASTRSTMQVIYAPLLDAQPVDVQLTSPVTDLYTRDVVFSSANAVRFAPKPQSGQRAYCIGDRTTDVARAKGWQAKCCGQDADQLVRTVTELSPETPLVHLRGVHSRGDIAKRLCQAGINCQEHVIYDQVLLRYDDQSRAALDAQASLIVPLFSPRTAVQFVKLAPYRAELHLIAFSKAVAEPLNVLKCKDLQICNSPTAKDMCALVRDAAAGLARVEGGPSAQ